MKERANGSKLETRQLCPCAGGHRRRPALCANDVDGFNQSKVLLGCGQHEQASSWMDTVAGYPCTSCRTVLERWLLPPIGVGWEDCLIQRLPSGPGSPDRHAPARPAATDALPSMPPVPLLARPPSLSGRATGASPRSPAPMHPLAAGSTPPASGRPLPAVRSAMPLSRRAMGATPGCRTPPGAGSRGSTGRRLRSPVRETEP